MKRTMALALVLHLAAWAVAGEVRNENTEARLQNPATDNRITDVVDGADAITIPRLLSYQGRLTDTMGIPVPNGNYSVAFRLYTQPSGGSAFWNETQNVSTREGLFSALLGSATPIGSMPDAGAVYLGMAVGGGAELTPRLRIASAAYAYLTERAANSDLLQGRDTTTFSRSTHNHDATYVNEGQASSVTSTMITDATIAAVDLGQMGAGTGQVMKWTGSAWAPRNDSVGQGGTGDNAWVHGSDSVLYTIRQLGIARGGAGNTLYGSQAFTHVNLGASSTTGASGQNFSGCTVGGGSGNDAAGGYATVGGGWGNGAAGHRATVGGGYADTASGDYAAIGGGYHNMASGSDAAVGGGFDNTASGHSATVGGGFVNKASGDYAAIGGGEYCLADSAWATVGGGYADTACARAATVSGGYANTASGKFATVGGGANNAARADGATVAGGVACVAQASGSFVGGGRLNTATGLNSAVLCGEYNQAVGQYAIASGLSNTAQGRTSTVSGGGSNLAATEGSTVGGGYYNRAEYSLFATVAGGDSNWADDRAATVAGGHANTAFMPYSAVGGGALNYARDYGSVPGGYADTVTGSYAFASNNHSYAGHDNAAAFTGSHTTASNQVRAQSFSQGFGTFTMDHPADPLNRILNQYAVGASELLFVSTGTAFLAGDGRATVCLPSYFDAVCRNPRVQLTGVGTSDVYVAEKVSGNQFVIGGKPGTEVYWTVTGERRDQNAELARICTPVEQQKTGELQGHSLDDDGLAGCWPELQNRGQTGQFSFRTAASRRQAEEMARMSREAEIQSRNKKP